MWHFASAFVKARDWHGYTRGKPVPSKRAQDCPNRARNEGDMLKSVF